LVSWNQKSKNSLDLNKARDDRVLGCSGISWTICKKSAPCSRQKTTPTSHHSIFTGRMLFLMPNQQCQSTEGNTKNRKNKSNMHVGWLHEYCKKATGGETIQCLVVDRSHVLDKGSWWLTAAEVDKLVGNTTVWPAVN